MSKITKIGNSLIKCITTVLAIIFLIYGLLMLWDMYRTELKAFSSFDLLQYRPNIEVDEPPYFEDLREINPDVKGWVTIYNTNIDYPVLQGKDDMEYLNKDMYGKFSLPGSIYLACRNSPDFSDNYNLLYGHHLENGSMFGDIDKFQDKEFFNNNEKGILILDNMAYDLKVIALLSTDAYNNNIFTVGNVDINSHLNYIKSISTFYREEKDINKLIALSTCDANYFDGRNIIICDMKVRTEPLPSREAGKGTQKREAVGHKMAGAYWALLNLIILLAIIFTTVKLCIFKGNKLKKFIYIGLSGISIILFYLTENMHKPIQIIDIYTIVFILILILIYIIEKRIIRFTNKSAINSKYNKNKRKVK